MHVSKREQFLLDIQAYLMNGGLVIGMTPKKRTQSEARAIMNDPGLFQRVDVIEDELNLFGLTVHDFFEEEDLGTQKTLAVQDN